MVLVALMVNGCPSSLALVLVVPSGGGFSGASEVPSCAGAVRTMHKCPKEAASRNRDDGRANGGAAAGHPVRSSNKASMGRRARLIVASRASSERYEVLWSRLLRGQSRQQSRCSFGTRAASLVYRRSGSRLIASHATMKVIVALALPAAALKPVPVTMSAQQGRRNFVIGGARAVQHSRLQEARGDNQHQN